VSAHTLAQAGIELGPIVLGGNVFGWTVETTRAFAILDAFLDAGGVAIDTADVYSMWVPGNQGGESETMLGHWLAQGGRRARVVLATKVGWSWSAGRGLSRQRIVEAIEASLRRLQTDYVDLYQSHVDDSSVPFEETLDAYQQLIAQGKVRAIGASNITGDRLQAALDTSRRHQLPLYQSVQPHYNLYERAAYEDTLEPVCARHGLAVLPYYALASGFLTGKYRSAADLVDRPRASDLAPYLTPRGLAIVQALDEVAQAYGVPPAAVALAWLMARPTVTAPIASVTSVAQLGDLMQAVGLALDAEALAKLDQASAYGLVTQEA
jgi:aryl-alcohol dehydrogenase-like predicted oxidoreductase